MLLWAENGDYIDFEESYMVSALENATDDDIRYFKASAEEQARYVKIYDRLTAEMVAKYEQSIVPVKRYNEQKLLNWAQIQKVQLQLQMQELRALVEEVMARDILEKKDIQKKMGEKKKQLDKLEKEVQRKTKHFDEEAKNDIRAFNDGLAINPFLRINIVLKF